MLAAFSQLLKQRKDEQLTVWNQVNMTPKGCDDICNTCHFLKFLVMSLIFYTIWYVNHLISIILFYIGFLKCVLKINETFDSTLLNKTCQIYYIVQIGKISSQSDIADIYSFLLWITYIILKWFQKQLFQKKDVGGDWRCVHVWSYNHVRTLITCTHPPSGSGNLVRVSVWALGVLPYSQRCWLSRHTLLFL